MRFDSMTIETGRCADVDPRRLLEVGPAHRFIVPEFQARSKKRRVQPFNDVSYNWAGGIARAPTGQSFQSVFGKWWIPTVTAPTDGADGTYEVSHWIGLGGTAAINSPLVQIGVVQTAIKTGTKISIPKPGIFCSWVPGGDVQVLNFDIEPNMLVQMGITATSQYDAAISLWIGEQTTAFTIDVSHESANMLAGESAEWVIERPFNWDTEDFAPLAKCTPVVFASSTAYVAPGAPGSSNLGSSVYGTSSPLCDMISNDDRKLATALANGPFLDCMWVASY